MDSDVVRQRIRQRLQDGRLSHDGMIELAHGQGIDQRCHGCGEKITGEQRMTVPLCSADQKPVRLHDECFQIWNAERNHDRDDG
jgi:hypothetical protein